MGTLINDRRPQISVVCLRCCRFGRLSREALIARFGNEVYVEELPFLLAEASGCNLATRAWRDPYNPTMVRCAARLLTDAECRLNCRAVWESVRRGNGIPTL